MNCTGQYMRTNISHCLCIHWSAQWKLLSLIRLAKVIFIVYSMHSFVRTWCLVIEYILEPSSTTEASSVC